MTENANGTDLPYPREITAILVTPDLPGELVRLQNNHSAICERLKAHNTEAYFFQTVPAIAWLSATPDGESNHVARGFIEAVEGPRPSNSVLGPVLLVGIGNDEYSGDVPAGLLAAARLYGVLPDDA